MWKEGVQNDGQNRGRWGHLGGSVVEGLPSAQGMIPESWDRAPQTALSRESAAPSAFPSPGMFSLSLSLSLSLK